MMQVLRAFLLALRAIRRNVLRASLTVLGILIGVAAVVIVTALGQGARGSITKQIEAIGNNLIIISPQRRAASGAKTKGGGRLTEEDARAIVREIPAIQDVAPVLQAPARVVFGDQNADTTVIGTTKAYLKVRGYAIKTGEFWQDSDETSKTRVAVLGKTVATRLFNNGDPVGQDVRIGKYLYRVIGVLASKGGGALGDQDDTILMPIGSVRSRLLRAPPGYAGVLMASAASPDQMEHGASKVTDLLRQRHRIPEGDDQDFQVQNLGAIKELIGGIYDILTALLVVIAAISLIVGGIGVMNIMLVSVTERTREIGIRMAIGARAGDIQIQFLVEAVVLSLLGGLVGIVLGLGVTFGVTRFLEWDFTVNQIALVASALVSGGIGVGFGFFPARRAALLDPMTALRRE
jgi:putative ABC transport system permease protein